MVRDSAQDQDSIDEELTMEVPDPGWGGRGSGEVHYSAVHDITYRCSNNVLIFMNTPKVNTSWGGILHRGRGSRGQRRGRSFVQVSLGTRPSFGMLYVGWLLIGWNRCRNWRVRAAKLGHPGAQSHVMAVFEKKEEGDYDGFTYTSCQTFTEHTRAHYAMKVNTNPNLVEEVEI